MLPRLALFLVATILTVACSGDSGVTDTGDGTPTPVAATCELDGDLPAPVLATCDDLAERFGQSPDSVVSMTMTEWPDACLGVPEPDEVCAQVIVSGYQVVFSVDSNRYTYRTDGGVNVRFAGFEIRRPAEDAGAQLVARAAEPVAFDISAGGRLFFTLRQEGEIRWVFVGPSAAAGESVPRTAALGGRGAFFAQVEVFLGLECGLLGIVLDPDFKTNRYVYVYAIQPVAGRNDVGKPRVIRYTDVNGMGEDPTIIVGDLPFTNPKTCAHVGGNLHFGPDGYLYLSMGNNERSDEAVAADLSSPLGKILRIDKADGSAAPGNPFASDAAADPRVFAYGFRNPWDFAFHPATDEIYAPDNGPGNCDELNIVRAGADYGVPDSLPTSLATTCLGLGGVDPIHLFAQPGTSAHEFGSNVAPTGVAFLEAGVYAGLGEGLLVCEFLTGSLRLLEFAGPDFDQVVSDRVIFDFCRFNVGLDADGVIYVAFEDATFRLPPEELTITP